MSTEKSQREQLVDEIGELFKRLGEDRDRGLYEQLRRLAPQAAAPTDGKRKTPGDQFVEAQTIQDMIGVKAQKSGPVYIDLPGYTLKRGERYDPIVRKDVTASQFPSVRVFPPFVGIPTRRIRVRDLIPVVGFDAQGIEFARITGYSNNAAPVTEGATKPTSNIVTEKVTRTLAKVATMIPISREAVEDVDQIRQAVDNFLELFVGLAEDDQILNGNGAAGNMFGLLNEPDLQVSAVGAGTHPKLAAIRHAVTLIQTAFTSTGFEPTGLVLHPADTEELDLLLDGDNRYLLLPDGGPPTELGVRRIWGLPVVVTPSITEGTGLVGDFAGAATYYQREGLITRVTDSHSDWFAKNILAILAETRGLVACWSPKAFCKVTGL